VPGSARVAIALAASLALARVASAEAPVSALRLEVADDFSEVRGEVRVTVRNSTEAPLGEIEVWLPFNRLEEPPAELDQRNAHWIYPRAFNPGRTDVERIRCDGVELSPAELRFRDDLAPSLGPGQRVLADLALPRPLAPGESVGVELQFRTEVPRRLNRLGRTRRELVLAGAFYPQVAALGPGGWDLTTPVAVDYSWQVELRAPAGAGVVLNERFEVAPGGGEPLRVSLAPAPYVALVVARRFHRTVARAAGTEIEILSLGARYRPPRREGGPPEGSSISVPGDVIDSTRWDWQGRAIDAATATLQVLRELGIEPPARPVRFVEAPLRFELVSPIPGGVLLSDRLYRLTPIEQFFRFHDLQVARAVGWLALDGATAREPAPDRALALDLLGAAVSDAFAESRYGGRGPGLQRLLGIGAFIPEIDQILYSPLIEFRHLFTRPFRDEDPLREEPWQLASDWPRGAVIHDKLADLLGQDAVQRLLGRYARSAAPLRRLVDEMAGEDMSWFFDQWLGPAPEVAYRLAGVTSERLGRGRFRHRAVIERLGASIREPVEVRFLYADGTHEDLRWDGRGARGEVAAERGARLRSVEIDPRGRLLEAASLTGENPNLDNIEPVRWRLPVLNGLMLYLSAAEGKLYALIDFSLRRQYDARRAIRLRVEYDPRGVRGDLFYSHGLGRLLDLDRASWMIQAGVYALRTIGSFGEGHADATAFGANLFLYRDTRWFRYDPMEGWGMNVAVFGSGWVDDESAWGWSVGAAGRIAGHWTPRVGHTFTGYAGAGVVFGEPLQQQLQSISDRTMLRGFEADETLGRARIYGVVEYRWTALTDLDVNLINAAWWREMFLVVFVGAGTVSRPDSLEGLFSADRIFTEVGAGVRFLVDLAGVQPYVIALDAAVPITPLERPGRVPYGFYVSIQHTM
jgi:hypothetical protein